MAKTVVEKVASPDLDVTIFKISGTLGFHENQVLVKFFHECSSRNINKLVLDFCDLGSLGGGCAKIIREAAGAGVVQLCISGASRVVQNFLQNKGSTAILFAPDVESGLARLRNAPSIGEASSAPVSQPENTPSPAPQPQKGPSEPNVAVAEPPIPPSPASPPQSPPSPGPSLKDADCESHVGDDVMAQIDAILVENPESPNPTADLGSRQVPPPVSKEVPIESGPSTIKSGAIPYSAEEIKGLKKKLVQFRALFSLNSEFSRIGEKARLLDAFLLTTIAQVGVESAAFLELIGDEFIAACWKGFETADPTSLNISVSEVDMVAWMGSTEIYDLKSAPLSDTARSRIGLWDIRYASPFIVHDKFRGIVLLGQPIRHALDDDSWEFLSMMFNQVAISYENSCRLEKQNERTLGLVQSLISMIESNTLSRGTTEMVMDHTYAVAVKMHYPEENIRDLLYGVILRDIGMINTSDLILRSPRELEQEEWDVIKRHPAEGAEMLFNMGFSAHTRQIVLYHHERSNGEGYPEGLSGARIPLGARILSVVESYAAMLQERPTRAALPPEEALNTLKDNWGLRYDPDVITAFSEVIEDEIRMGKRQKYKGLELIRS
jgi:hypothetical protein